MILTVVPNPAIDKTVVIPEFATGHTFRVPRALALAGGKGFNVARTLRTLGAAVVVVAPLGGHTGEALLDLATADELVCVNIPIQGETRTCLTIVDPETARITEIYEGGPTLASGEWEQLVEGVTNQIPAAVAVVVSGSLPPGAPITALSRLVELANTSGVPTLLDSYGPPLAAALPARPALVKINQHEAAGLVGGPVETLEAAMKALYKLQELGAREVVITLGKHGAVAVDAAGAAFGWSTAEVGGLYPIGSGDSLFGGLVARLASGHNLVEALRLGVAVGAANTLKAGAGLFDPQEVEALLVRTRPLELPK